MMLVELAVGGVSVELLWSELMLVGESIEK